MSLLSRPASRLRSWSHSVLFIPLALHRFLRGTRHRDSFMRTGIHALFVTHIIQGMSLFALESLMSSNRLSLKPTKTTLIWLCTRQQLARLDLTTVAAEFSSLILSTGVRDLCILLDQELTFAPHVHRLARHYYYQL